MIAAEQASSIDFFFNPQTIAIIGASRHAGKVGHEVVRNLLLSGYKGGIYPVNPFATSILGLKTYCNLSEITSAIDIAVLAVPAGLVKSTMEQCVKNHVRGAIILSTGFSDKGNVELEDEIASIARKGRLRFLGPNSFGIFSVKSSMNCTFGSNSVIPGKTAFISQSCALGLSLMTWTTEQRYRLSSIVSTGTKSDIDDADLLEYYAQDDTSNSIVIYMEGLKNPRKFFESAKRVVQRKPIIVIKSGRSTRGALAARSHTGSMIGSHSVFDSISKSIGLMRSPTLTEAFDWAKAFNNNPTPTGENLMIVTNCGALGVMATDRCDSLGLKISETTEDVKGRIAEIVPGASSLHNPIDVNPESDEEIYYRLLWALLRQNEINGIILLFAQTDVIDPTLVSRSIVKLKNDVGGFSKPITIGIKGGTLAQLAYTKLLEEKIAAYPTMSRAVDTMYALVLRHRLLSARSKKQSLRLPAEIRELPEI
jgi:acetate---CoA ligase (ADP-forming) subunit alpha